MASTPAVKPDRVVSTPAVKPNRRGVKSRELVLDAAERVMAEEGFEGATLARVVEQAGIPPSSVYHYFGSKEGVLLAMMERGAERFFADLPEPASPPAAAPLEYLQPVLSATVATLQRHPSFLRMLIVFSIQPPRAGDGEIRAVVGRVREMALIQLRHEIATAFGERHRSKRVDRLARFALASIDGAFLAVQTDGALTLARLLEPLPYALVAAHDAL